jgi:hypothetical protein
LETGLDFTGLKEEGALDWTAFLAIAVREGCWEDCCFGATEPRESGGSS